jgi:hypothetical protein
MGERRAHLDRMLELLRCGAVIDAHHGRGAAEAAHEELHLAS